MVHFGPEAEGTRYKAIALHVDSAGKQKHEDMGFFQGWGTALEQLVAHAKSL
ncbi:MAG: SRPBCC domain-containing protein [Planctomycetes bacterium]|nr:SRPBCC domain-containing protein [Planctomycetota bacterium]MCB9919130.1 SRPBCC domain-containing protein [Planctomycetota bacterium]